MKKIKTLEQLETALLSSGFKNLRNKKLAVAYFDQQIKDKSNPSRLILIDTLHGFYSFINR